MAHGSDIEWTESTWNPVTGCTKVSAGCKHCYAERMARRLQAMGQVNYRDGFAVTLQEHMLERPLSWRRPQTIFVNSMSDLFHEQVPLDYIERVFDVMSRAHWHRFQVLTNPDLGVRTTNAPAPHKSARVGLQMPGGGRWRGDSTSRNLRLVSRGVLLALRSRAATTAGPGHFQSRIDGPLP